MAVRQGQYFVIGALLIATFITGIVLVDFGSVHTPATQTPKQLFDRGMDEFPRAVNLALMENASDVHLQQRLTTYLLFQQDTLQVHGLSSDAHTVLTTPDDGDVSVLVGNMRQAAMDNVTVVLDGETQQVDTIPSGETRLLTFTGVSDTFDVEASFTADKEFSHVFTAHRGQTGGVYHLRVSGEHQTWQNTAVY